MLRAKPFHEEPFQVIRAGVLGDAMLDMHGTWELQIN